MNMEPEVTLSGHDIAIGYGATVLQRRMELQLVPGALTCLLGPNGAGKSTLLRTLCRLQPPLEGRLQLGGVPLDKLSQTEIARRIAIVTTGSDIFGRVNVQDVVMAGRHPHTGFWGTPRQHDREVVEEALALFSLTGFRNRAVASLSDGERQKVMIAKAVAQECPVILLDEPTAFLDLPSRIDLMLTLRRLTARQHKTVLLSTHDIDLALQYADRIWLLSRKAGLVCGFPEDLAVSGRFGACFDTDTIRFDAGRGQFSGTQAEAPACHVASDAPHRLWVCRLAARNGFQVADRTEEALFRVTSSGLPPSGYCLEEPRGMHQAPSLARLAALFETIRPVQ